VVVDADVGGDGNVMPAPAQFLIDPLNSTDVLIGHVPCVARAGERPRLDCGQCHKPGA